MKRFAFLTIVVVSSLASWLSQARHEPEFFVAFSFETLNTGISTDLTVTTSLESCIDTNTSFAMNFGYKLSGGFGWSLLQFDSDANFLRRRTVKSTARNGFYFAVLHKGEAEGGNNIETLGPDRNLPSQIYSFLAFERTI
jgi:hypothetical protein